MGNDDDRDAQSLVDIPDQLQNRVGGLRIQGAGGLVAEQHLRIGSQGSRDGNTLLLSAGELGRIGIGLIGKADHVQKLQGTFFRFILVHADEFQGEANILQAGSLHQQVEALENHSHVPAHRPKLFI